MIGRSSAAPIFQSAAADFARYFWRTARGVLARRNASSRMLRGTRTSCDPSSAITVSIAPPLDHAIDGNGGTSTPLNSERPTIKHPLFAGTETNENSSNSDVLNL